MESTNSPAAAPYVLDEYQIRIFDAGLLVRTVLSLSRQDARTVARRLSRFGGGLGSAEITGNGYRERYVNGKVAR